MSLFEKATKTPRRLKMYIYGAVGSGKSFTSLHFPSPAVVDTEQGTNHYGKLFDFDVKYSSKLSDLNEIVDGLLLDSQGYKTLVIDPFTNIWDRMINDLQTYLRKKKDDAAYMIQGLDYRMLKSQLKNLVSKFNDLDMNIVVTARSKALYSQDEGDFMKQVGTIADGPKDLPGMFDVVLEIVVDPKTGERTAHVDKDRTNTLPRVFDFSYEKLSGFFGMEDLEREPVLIDRDKKNLSGRSVEITHKTKKMYTAGVTSKQLDMIEKGVKGKNTDSMMETLSNDFGVASFLDLREDEAALFITEITK